MSKVLSSGFIACTLASGLIAAGCGGDGNTTTTAISKKEFIKRADAICAKGDKKDNAAGDKFFKKNPNPTNAQEVQFLKQHSIPGNQFKVDGIRALGAPSGDEAKIEAILDAAQQAVNQAKQNPLVLLKEQGPPVFAKVDKLTAAYGLKGCSGD